MRLISNTGNDRAINVLGDALRGASALDCATPGVSIFALFEMLALLGKDSRLRVLTSPPTEGRLHLSGDATERLRRNRLDAHYLAGECARRLQSNTELRFSPAPLPQAVLTAKGEGLLPILAMAGNCPLTLEGMGLVPGNRFGLIQCSESEGEAGMLAAWFDSMWTSLADAPEAMSTLMVALTGLTKDHPASAVYHLMLDRLFLNLEGPLDEDRIANPATGIRRTTVWNKLFKFQRDGVLGALDKLERFGGCIIADSVGLGKTFEALAIIKYHELRNDRVLVLCPKRLRDNWTLYKANDRRNILAGDRFNYDVLNHTDLSRDTGKSGDIELSRVNWGNYDLVVIDESHNFRNKKTPKQGGETRYDRLMRRIIQEGVKTRVLMLSATPVNNRLADLRNQIAFVTEGSDDALAEHGVASIDSTIRLAQKQFNNWLKQEEEDRTPSLLLDMLGFDYFKLLDLLTIARSRKHIEKYYGTAETGKFPERLKPVNHKADVDRAGEFSSIKEINTEIRRLHLAAYAPLSYILPHKQAEYDSLYSTKLNRGEGYFRQRDREDSLIHLLRVNALKRMESAVTSFALTLERQLADVDATIARLDEQPDTIEEINIEDIDIEDPLFESLLAGTKVKVLLKDMDLIKWRSELQEDRNRLATLLSAARAVDSSRDAKLEKLRAVIAEKVDRPINPGNRKVIVFTAFADTASYLYEQLAPWALGLGLHSGLVTGSKKNQTTLPGLRKDQTSILSAFAPRAKDRPEELAGEGEIDLLIATDCISEGQNLQDCDFLINYDIHWNPVRIIQRFGRIDRIGSPNERIQLVNFWPNIELEEYINLEQRVSGRMVLLDISATGEENIIEQQSGNQMNDLEYRRVQLLKLQETVIDLEDLSSGVSIADLTLTDFRIDVASYRKANPGLLEAMPPACFAVVPAGTGENALPPGIIFCLQAVNESPGQSIDPGYPLAPHYLVHVGEDGTILLPHGQARAILDRLKRASLGRDLPDPLACGRFHTATKGGADMAKARELLEAAVASIAGKKLENAVESLFTPGGTRLASGESVGLDDFEVVGFLVILPDSP